MERILASYPVPTVALSDVFAPASSFPTIGSLVTVIIKNAFMFAGIIFLILLIFGGFSFIVSAGSGDAKKMDQGKQAITASVTGLIIIFASYWIIQIIEIITGVTILPK